MGAENQKPEDKKSHEKDLEFEFEDKKSNVENIDKHRLEKVKKLK